MRIDEFLSLSVEQINVLQTLNLSRNNLDILDEARIRALGNGLSKFKVRTLDLSDNNLGDLDEAHIQALGNGLSKSKVQTLNLSGNNLGDLDEARIRALGDGLSKSKVRTLDLSWNNFDALDVPRLQVLVDILGQCHSLQTIELAGNDLNAAQIQLFQSIGQARQKQIAEYKRNSKTFLLCWNRWKQEEPTTTTLWCLPKEIIMKILDDAGYTQNAEMGRPETAKKPLTLKFRHGSENA